jgi:hypothetical protein
MKRIVHLAASALLLAGTGTAAMAQDSTGSRRFFQPPSFAILPSALTTNVISAPEGADSHTAFNARFQAVVPTISPWFALVGGAQWGVKREDHGPIIFLGGIIPLVPINNATGGLLSFSIDPLYVVGPTTAPGAGIFASHDFVLEGAAVLGIGQMMMKNMAFWSGLSAFFLLDQNITTAKGEDSFNPVLIYGLALPIAP